MSEQRTSGPADQFLLPAGYNKLKYGSRLEPDQGHLRVFVLHCSSSNKNEAINTTGTKAPLFTKILLDVRPQLQLFKGKPRYFCFICCRASSNKPLEQPFGISIM